MPFKSKAQMRKFYAMEARGEIPKGTTERWKKHTKSISKLPERKSAQSGKRSQHRKKESSFYPALDDYLLVSRQLDTISDIVVKSATATLRNLRNLTANQYTVVGPDSTMPRPKMPALTTLLDRLRPEQLSLPSRNPANSLSKQLGYLTPVSNRPIRYV